MQSESGAEKKKNVGLGIDLGGTKIAAALFSSNGMISPKEVVYLENRVGNQVAEQIIEIIHFFWKWADKNELRISAIGIAVPGIYYSKTGRVWAPNVPGWEDYPLLEELSNIFNDISIKIDSDRACYILGETWKGSSIGCKDAIFLAVGTGIGAGILIDGQVLRGANDIAGAIGWMTLTSPYLSEYKHYGCFEYHASGEGLSRMAEKYSENNTDLFKDADQLTGNQITSMNIFDAYRKDHSTAIKVIRESIEFWGKASANLVSLFNPEKIIFGGGVFGPAIQFLDEIYMEAKKWAQPISINKVKFEPSKFGGEAGLYGAGYLSLYQNNI